MCKLLISWSQNHENSAQSWESRPSFTSWHADCVRDRTGTIPALIPPIETNAMITPSNARRFTLRKASLASTAAFGILAILALGSNAQEAKKEKADDKM